MNNKLQYWIELNHVKLFYKKHAWWKKQKVCFVKGNNYVFQMSFILGNFWKQKLICLYFGCVIDFEGYILQAT